MYVYVLYKDVRECICFYGKWDIICYFLRIYCFNIWNIKCIFGLLVIFRDVFIKSSDKIFDG